MSVQNTGTLEPVLEAKLIASARARVEELVEAPDTIRMEQLSSLGWVAVPVESAGHFDEADAQNLTRALASLGQEACLAVITDEVPQADSVFRLPVTQDGLLEFSTELGHLNSVLIPETNSGFVVLCSVDDFFIVAGPEPLVRLVFPQGINSARVAFLSYANDEALPSSAKERLQEVARLAR